MVRNDLITLLTGFGYYVDYVNTRIEGLKKYRHYKHAIVIFDVPALPRFPKRVFRLFRFFSRNPIILIAAKPQEQPLINKYIEERGVFDTIELPLHVNVLAFKLRRLLEHNLLQANNEFMRLLITLILFAIPVWALLMYLIGVKIKALL